MDAEYSTDQRLASLSFVLSFEHLHFDNLMGHNQTDPAAFDSPVNRGVPAQGHPIPLDHRGAVLQGNVVLFAYYLSILLKRLHDYYARNKTPFLFFFHNLSSTRLRSSNRHNPTSLAAL